MLNMRLMKKYIELINKDQTIRKHINGKIIRKIFIKNKLINLII